MLAGAAAYALAGFLIAPRAIQLWIESPNVSGPGCRFRVQQVYVNPFTMFLSLRDATLFEQESKSLLSASVAETRVWSVDRLRGGTAGRDVVLRNLVVTTNQSGDPLLAVPSARLRNVTIGAGGKFIDVAHAHLERPDAAVARDSDGMRHHAAWLAVPGNDRAEACISFDGFRAAGGKLRARDDAVTPSVQLELHNVEAGALRKPGSDTATIDVDVEARLGTRGAISISARLRDGSGHHPDRFSMTARNVDLPLLSPYFRRIFGRDIVAGSGDVTLQHERHDAGLRFDNRVRFDRLTLDDADDESTKDTPMLELALALATDEAGQSEYSIKGSVAYSQAQTVVSVFADSLLAHLDDLAARPFDVLAELAGEPNTALDAIGFLPGSAEMAPSASETLARLGEVIARRPRLGMNVRPAYDPVTDRDAIAAQQVGLHIALATSASAGHRGNAAVPDFGDPRVRDVLDEFAGARLSEAQRRAISRGVSDEAATYRGIYLALVENERVSETVLRRLARFRARSVIDAFERNGIDRSRFRIADALDATATGARTVSVRLEVEARPASHNPDDHDDDPGNIE